MTDFTINEMLEMQRALQEKYKDKWEPISPEAGQSHLLWMVGEIGEAALRKDLVEELSDVLMHYNDILLCYGISAGELKRAFTEKFEKNMRRW